MENDSLIFIDLRHRQFRWTLGLHSVECEIKILHFFKIFPVGKSFLKNWFAESLLFKILRSDQSKQLITYHNITNLSV